MGMENFFWKWDHPRACGENLICAVASVACMGSPPRMRGKLKRINRNKIVKGITPAHAGKTSVDKDALKADGDHPRACGENDNAGNLIRDTWGSPPRMRGKLQSFSPSFSAGGITPAHAGKTQLAAREGRKERDHPRACGENASALPPVSVTLGSPPRMRGKQLSRIERLSRSGITPAHAGKTMRRRGQPSRRWDHPRACGENARFPSSSTSEKGSPPRMRGKQHPA